jgi:hypothetical protein
MNSPNARPFLLTAALLGLGFSVACQVELDEASDADAGIVEGSGSGDGRELCALVMTSDFSQTAALHTAHYRGGELKLSEPLTSVSTDAILRGNDRIVTVLNRYPAAYLQRIDPAAGFATVWERALPAGSNPSDIWIAENGRAVISLYGAGRPIAGGELIEVNLLAASEADWIVGRRSLAAWTEADGNPEASQLIPFGGLLFVVLQRLDNYPGCSDGGRSALLALDAQTLEPVGHFGGSATLTLAGCNAYSAALHEDGRLMVALTGRFQWSGDQSDDGGVEAVDLSQGVSLGWLSREGAFGNGDITEVTAASDGSTLWVASSADFAGSIFRAASDGMVSGPLWSGSNLFDVTAQGDSIWVANRSSISAAVVLLDGAGQELGRAIPPAPPIAFLPLEAAGLCP